MRKINLKPHQLSFLDAPEQYVGLFGGIGNGKTFAACLKVIELATNYPKNLCFVGRMTYPELRDSTREVFLSALKQLYPSDAYKFNKAENSVQFWNESQIIFRHLDNQESLLGPNLGAFYIDQAEEVDEEAFLTLQGRLRRSGVPVLKGLITGNPKGYNWLYYRFGMDKANNAKEWPHNQIYRMITAPTIANRDNLPINYIDQLKQSYSPEWFERYVNGSWDAFEGQIFDLTQITGFDTLPEIRFVVTACDPAISKEKDACNTAFCTLGVALNGHIYDLETIANKWSFLETLEEAKKILSRQKSNYLGVEDTAYQSALVEACQRYFPEITVVNLKADRDKFRRAKSVSHIIAKGLFHTNNRDLLAELSAFDPDANGKEKKDRVDAMVHAMHMVQTYAPIKFEVKKNEFEGLNPHQAWFKKVEDEEKRRLLGEVSTMTFDGDGIGQPINPDYF